MEKKRMGALATQKSCLHCIKKLVNFGTPTPESTVMVWRPFVHQMGETLSVLGTRIRQRIAGTAERICAKFTEDVPGPSLGRVGMSTSKVKGQGHYGKTRCELTTPPQYG